MLEVFTVILCKSNPPRWSKLDAQKVTHPNHLSHFKISFLMYDSFYTVCLYFLSDSCLSWHVWLSTGTNPSGKMSKKTGHIWRAQGASRETPKDDLQPPACPATPGRQSLPTALGMALSPLHWQAAEAIPAMKSSTGNHRPPEVHCPLQPRREKNLG